ncbi:hypothetical protein AAX08_01160 [Moraxella bovoculi]|nr:hypothetical protein AAX08_01160 [Moraxella bovoculi]
MVNDGKFIVFCPFGMIKKADCAKIPLLVLDFQMVKIFGFVYLFVYLSRTFLSNINKINML